MKTKRNRTKSKTHKLSPFMIFIITLAAFLTVGIVGLFLVKTTVTTAEPVVKETPTHPGWEKIPQQSQQEPDEEAGKYAEELADSEFMRKNRILAWESSSEEEVTIGFTGDILLDDEYAVMANLLRRGLTIENGLSEALLAQMRGVDILVANNEFAFTDRGTPLEGKTYTFRADTGSVSYLCDMGVDVAVLANNHIYDFGETGLLDTLDTLEQADIPSIGAGRNLEEASAPLYFIVNDMKIAIVAATQIERLDNPDTHGATQDSAGTFRCWNPEKLYEVIKQADENSDFVIVYVHWGTENEAQPDWAQEDQSVGMAQAGADLIIGDHPHCLQGITYVDETPVFYSLGNFWFNSKTVDTGMVRATINANGLKALQFLPAIQCDSKTDLAYGADEERILSYLRSLSPLAQIDEDGYISKQ